MPKFKDAKGREWELAVNVTSMERVKSLAGFDLLTVLDHADNVTKLRDPYTLANVLFALVKPQADEAEVSDEAFGEGLAGDPIEDASDALLEGLVLFFPKGRRQLLQMATAKQKEIDGRLQAKRVEAVRKKLDQMATAAERKVDAAIAALNVSGDSPTASPESPALTPAP